jgi:hypothetical protein
MVVLARRFLFYCTRAWGIFHRHILWSQAPVATVQLSPSFNGSELVIHSQQEIIFEWPDRRPSRLIFGWFWRCKRRRRQLSDGISTMPSSLFTASLFTPSSMDIVSTHLPTRTSNILTVLSTPLVTIWFSPKNFADQIVCRWSLKTHTDDGSQRMSQMDTVPSDCAVEISVKRRLLTSQVVNFVMWRMDWILRPAVMSWTCAVWSLEQEIKRSLSSSSIWLTTDSWESSLMIGSCTTWLSSLSKLQTWISPSPEPLIPRLL